MAENLKKSLSKLKVIELKEKLQELGKTPKGLKADLVIQLAEAIDEQNQLANNAGAGQTLPPPSLQTFPPQELVGAAGLQRDTNEPQHYYQQPVPPFAMSGQPVYEQPTQYIQSPYETPYPYQTHQVFSPPHEQQYQQSPNQYQMPAQVSPGINTQIAAQLSPQMNSSLQQQLSPQLAQQYRPQEFQSPHRNFPTNDSEAYVTEYSGQTAAEAIPHYGHQIPHLDMHAMPQTQPQMTSPPHIHRPPVIENYPPELSQSHSFPPNITAYKPETESFIPSHQTITEPLVAQQSQQQHLVQTTAPQDMLDFDDVTLGVDPTADVQYGQQMGAFEAHQNPNQYQMNDNSNEFQHNVTDGQAFSQQHSLPPELEAENTNDDTNEATNDGSTDVETNEETNESFVTNDIQSADDVKELVTNFPEHQVIHHTSNINEDVAVQGLTAEEVPIVSLPNNTSVIMSLHQSPQQPKQMEENSEDLSQTDIESIKVESQYTNNEDMDTSSDQMTGDDNNLENENADKDIEDKDIEDKDIEDKDIEDKDNADKDIEDKDIADEDIEDVESQDTNESENKIEFENESKSNAETDIQDIKPVNEEIGINNEDIKPIDLQSNEIVSHLNNDIIVSIQRSAQEMPVESDKSDENEANYIEIEKTIIKTTITAVKDEVIEKPVKENGDLDRKSSDKKLTKNQKKKQRKKNRANRRQLVAEKQTNNENEDKMDIEEDEEEEIEIEYVPEEIQKDPVYFQYLKVFDKFRTGESIKQDDSAVVIFDPHRKMLERKKPVELELKDDDEIKDGELKVSKRKLKQMTRMTVADLKQRVSHPELVEMHDVTARDPLLLLHLKATRNSVPVPRHWCYKRKYLQGKRGFEKPPFKLPEFIRRTGIMEMRQALLEKEESKSLKAQMREKIRPKMGKIDIDYQKLHDAFFKWQTKPKMTIHGDLYYEGKEFETRLKEKRPGDLSNELRTALGMPTGPNSFKCPPPWLIAMQRYGPPPSYPNIKIPGLNAPIPDGCSFGYHAGGWGKPPVDEYGRPLYGDVFGVTTTTDQNLVEEEVDRTLWGEMEEESEEEEEEESEEEENEENAGNAKSATNDVDESGFVTPAEGLMTPSGLASVPTGTETPDMIELRKRKQIEDAMENRENPSLYTIIPEKSEKIGREMMGSAHTYDMGAATLRKGQGIDLALDPSELETGGMDQASMVARYEQTVREQSSHLAKEDLSDMVAEHAARQKRKKPQETSKSTKKYQFKF